MHASAASEIALILMKVSSLLLFREEVPTIEGGGITSDGLCATQERLQKDLVEQQS